VSLLGIALGVAVLITVLSVMNGFDDEITDRIFGMAPQLSVSGVGQPLSNWPNLAAELTKKPAVLAAAPYVSGQGLLSHANQVVPVLLTGIDPKHEAKVSILAEKMQSGRLGDLNDGRFGLIIGRKIADNLGLNVGDKVNVMIPEVSLTPVGLLPRFKPFTIKGIFSAGNGFGFDSQLAFTDLKDAQALFRLGQSVTGVRLKLADIYHAPELSTKLNQSLADNLYASDWTVQFGAFFKAIRLEKNMMFLVLSLIVAVAAFNLISSLVMIVNDKRSDVAILRTYGALPRTIMAIFMVQGCVIGLLGILSGLAIGLLLAYNVTDIVNFIQSLFGVKFLSDKVYFLDYLPSSIEWSDIWQISLIAFLLCLLATIYPAYSASRTQPAEALRYD